uniref:E3 ubiquitin-protein ligase TRIM39-like n=1 Tax=Poecilia reticulata TaxID=8081 RepID=A0A3P9PSK5_POERE
MIYVLFLGFLSSPGCAAPGKFRLPTSLFIAQFSPKSPCLHVQRGHAAILPCWLTFSQSAEDMEVLWYQGSDEFDLPVLLYKARAFDYSSQKASFAGRVSFGIKEETSGGLKAGDVSLKLENVTIEDVGKYTCYVINSDERDSASISLTVTETGRSPLLSAVMRDDNKVNVSCQSDGWHPEPELRWSDSKTVLIPANVSTKGDQNASEKFVRRRYVVLPNTFLRIIFAPYLGTKMPCAVCLTLGILLAPVSVAFLVMCFLYFRMKENVQLMDTGNKLIQIDGSILREDIRELPDGDRVTCLTAVRGSPGFSSGRYYWEVCLENATADLLKKSWWIGVTDKHKIPHDESLSPTTKNGFWFLSSCPNQEDTLQFSTEPETFIYVQSKPKTVGVYLDFDNRKLSFYNVEEKCLIGSLAAKFTGELFPLFNPGKGDLGKMEILQRSVIFVEEHCPLLTGADFATELTFVVEFCIPLM